VSGMIRRDPVRTMRSMRRALLVAFPLGLAACAGGSPHPAPVSPSGSLEVARLAASFFDDPAAKEEAFLASLLHDIGKLVLATRLPAKLREAHRLSIAEKIAPHEAESRVLGVTHAEIGGYLLALWGMPYPVVEAVAFHHRPSAVSGSAELGKEGREKMARLASTLKDIAAKIPDEINWVLRIDGHTDDVPIATPRFPSNWELSTGRAISVVKFLVSQGVPASRLAAAGFGEFQPLDGQEGEAFRQRNRRIELKLDQR